MSENRLNEQLKQDKDAIGELSPSQEAKEKSLRTMKEEIRSGGDSYRNMEKKKRRNQTLTGITATVAAAGIGGLVLISSDDMAGWFNPAGTVDDHDNEQDEQEAPEPVDENEEGAEDDGEDENEETEAEQASAVNFQYSDTDEWEITADTFNDRAQRFYNMDMQAVDADEPTDVIDEQPMRLLHEEGMPYSIYIPEGWVPNRTEEAASTRFEMAGDDGDVFVLLQFDSGDEEAARAELDEQIEEHGADRVADDEQWVHDYNWTMDMGDDPVEQYRSIDGNRVYNWSFVNPGDYPDTPVILFSVETVEDDEQIELAGYYHTSFQRVYPTKIDESDDTGMNNRPLDAEFLSMSDHGAGPRETLLNEVDDLGFSFYKRSLFSEPETGDRGQRMIRHESEYDQSVMEIGRFETVDEALTYQQDWRESESELADQAMEETDSRMHAGNLYGGEWLVNRDVLNLSMEVREELEMEGGLSEINGQEMFFVIEHDGYGYYMKTGGDMYFTEYIDLILHTWQWEDGTMLLEDETD